MDINWYTESFSQDYLRIYAHRDLSEAKAAVENLLRLIKLPDAAICLDLCCGFGRHLSHLHRKGIPAYGVDLSPILLRHASRVICNRDRLVQADMRRLPFTTCFDFIFSFFSSFGYFNDDHENLTVLREVGRILKPGGGFLLDYLNAEHVKKHLCLEDYHEFPEYTLHQKRRINWENNTVEKELLIDDKDGPRQYVEIVKLYELEHFQDFFENSGLRISRVMGNCEGVPHDANSSRLILIGEKI